MKLAIILARGGSKRVPKKNYKIFCGKPMIYWPIKAAKESKLFDKIEISTDSKKILNIARKFGVNTLHRRPKNLSGDGVTSFKVIKYEIRRILKIEKRIKYVCIIPGSTPFIEKNNLRESFFKLKKQKLNFVFMAKLVDKRALRSFKFEKKNHLKPVFSKFMNKRSQNVPKIYCDAGHFYWGRSLSWLKNKSVFSNKTSICIAKKESVDIDSQHDWKVATKLFKQKNKL